jgi:hypothetical protein
MAVDSGAPGSGAAATDAIRLLAGLFERANEAAGKLAADLDVSRIAGSACEHAYDALTSKQASGANSGDAAASSAPANSSAPVEVSGAAIEASGASAQ